MQGPLDVKPGEGLAKVLWYYGLANPGELGADRVKIPCPFHGDINPSLLINLEAGNYYCFGCGISGDGLDFVKAVERLKGNQLDDLQAVLRYYEIIKSEKAQKLNLNKYYVGRKHRSNKQLYIEAYDYYNGLLRVDWKRHDIPEVKEALSYMLERGFTANTLNHAKAKVTFQQAYSLIFPILDNGVFRGWVSRTMDPEIAKRRKYLYNTGFSRSNTLCGDYGKYPYTILCEGYMDRLKLKQYGARSVAAVLGWKLSAGQEQKLRKAGIKIIISALDNDDAGRKGTEYLHTLNGFTVFRWRYLKGIKDPGDFTREQYIKMRDKTQEDITNAGLNIKL